MGGVVGVVTLGEIASLLCGCRLGIGVRFLVRGVARALRLVIAWVAGPTDRLWRRIRAFRC